MLPQDNYYLKFEEPTKGTLLALRSIILSSHSSIETMWSYSMPFFKVGGKRFCYLWIDKKTGWPYIGFVNGNLMEFPELIQGNRSRMKIYRVNPSLEIDIDRVNEILQKAIKISLDEL